MTIKIISLEFSNKKYGSWKYDGLTRGVGGKPLPSEAEAYTFDTKIIPEIEKEISRILNEVFKVEEY